MIPIQEKILLLLSASLAFGFTYLPNKQWRILKNLSREWKKIDERVLKENVSKLYRSKLVDIKENPDQSHTLILTNKGKSKILTYHFQKMKINKKNWDGKWRFVMFDIPEKIKKGREALREKLKELGFRELQKSVFVIPYKCEKEIEFLIEFFQLRKYVRFGTIDSIDNELHLRQIFKTN
jgi:DNA-binding transcriptional regulator PaaX